MKNLVSFQLFESHDSEYDELMGKLLHLYGSIPLPKEKSSQVIKRIIMKTKGEFFKLGENIDLDYQETHDKVRFADYFDSLVKHQDIRGHNFEGFLCGVYGGTLSKRGSKYDITVNGENISVKFYRDENERVQLGSYESILSDYKDEIGGYESLGKVFHSDDYQLKKEIWDIISKDVHGWLIAHPNSDETEIIMHYFTKEQMGDFVLTGNTVAGKGGWIKQYQLAINSTYTDKQVHNISRVILPKVSTEELRKLAKNPEETKFSTEVFGPVGNKIRPDVIRYIMNNREQVLKNIQNYETFTRI